ncbi:D-alanyl-D-alanine carboxypeptidase family protein [Breoghania sp.]|uniref:D-alanyl-D-alanine carboxypeptidase family protein n=1 Tax=Breoghania sp. TaxID=2065378 RepID=UPI002AA72A01|nr:D-alanyl-D-alanine carboxypeptidase family protein [Breoghania sp.]
MPRVPTYQDTGIRLRPARQQMINVQANPDAFGAGIGRGLKQLSGGMREAAGAVARTLKDLDDMNAAKDGDNRYADWLREEQYGEGGFMRLQGRDALAAEKGFQEKAVRKQKEIGASLKGGAAEKYNVASTARLNGTLNKAIRHAAAARKTWTDETSAARLNTFGEDAVAAYENPKEIDKNILAGLNELDHLGELHGWDDEILQNRKVEYTSSVRLNTAQRMISDDPKAAEAYYEAHKDQFTGPHQATFMKALRSPLISANARAYAADILSAGRSSASGGPAAPAGVFQGPTKAKAFLLERSSQGDRAMDTLRLDDAFAENLAAMIQDAPPEIRKGLGINSGYRATEPQKGPRDHDLKKNGSAAAARNSVAPAGRSGRYTGQAVELSYNGASLAQAPQIAIDWLHSNAGKYGLHFLLSNESSHVETAVSRGGGTVAPARGSVASRSTMPSYDDIEAGLAKISDPDVRDATGKLIYAQMEAQAKAEKARTTAATARAYEMMEKDNVSPFDFPHDMTAEIGIDGMSKLMSYWEKQSAGEKVQSDEGLLYKLRLDAAKDPVAFADVDLTQHFDKLSKDARKELTDKQAAALKDSREARESGRVLMTAFSQAAAQLEAVGITTTGKIGNDRTKAAKRIARFQNALTEEIAAFTAANNGKKPTYADIQKMTDKLLLPIVIKKKETLGGSDYLWPDSETKGLLFDALHREDGTSVDVVVEYGDIPIHLRKAIAERLEGKLGRTPSEDEIVTRFEQWRLGQKDDEPISADP